MVIHAPRPVEPSEPSTGTTTAGAPQFTHAPSTRGVTAGVAAPPSAPLPKLPPVRPEIRHGTRQPQAALPPLEPPPTTTDAAQRPTVADVETFLGDGPAANPDADACALVVRLFAMRGSLSPQLQAGLDAMAPACAAQLVAAVGNSLPDDAAPAVMSAALHRVADPGLDPSARRGLCRNIAAKPQLRWPALAQGPLRRAPDMLAAHALPLLQACLAELRQPRRPADAVLDMLCLPLLLESENAHAPGMQLHLFSPGQAAAHLQDRAGEDTELLGLMDLGHASPGMVHHVLAHLRTEPGSAPRLAVVDALLDAQAACARVRQAAAVPAVSMPVSLFVPGVGHAGIAFALRHAGQAHAACDTLNERLYGPDVRLSISWETSFAVDEWRLELVERARRHFETLRAGAG